MESETFNDLERKVNEKKQKLDQKLKSLLSESPNYSTNKLNAVQLAGSDFFTEFESFISNASSENGSLSDVQVQDILVSIENILSFSVEYWNTIKVVSKISCQPQENFLCTSQAILTTYKKGKAKQLKKRFEEHNMPVTGFTKRKKHKLTSLKIDMVSLSLGLFLLVVSGLVVFQIEINTGMKYLFSRVLISLSIALVFTGVAKAKIQAQIKMPGLVITTFGTLAIFFILYFFNPAEVPKI